MDSIAERVEAVRRRPKRRLSLGLLIAAAACAHDWPAQSGSYSPGGPLGGGAMIRLTYNAGVDYDPAWFPDGSRFVYTAERIERFDRDRCLETMPAMGGSIIGEICDRQPLADDSVNAYSSAAVSADGRLAYVRAGSSLAVGWPLTPGFQDLVVAPLSDPTAVRVLRSIPYVGPSGRTHFGVSQVRWLDDSSLVYVGEFVTVGKACQGCSVDTLRSGLEIVRLDFGGPVPAISALPGTDQASSVFAHGADTVYFTRNGDSRVFRLILSTDSIAVVHDFGGEIARDVEVAGDRLVAVVGGIVSFVADPILGMVQRDSGGTIVLVERNTGTETPLTPEDALFRHPALSPDGTTVVAEWRIGRAADLYRFTLP
jgi:WD40-like Beta Propeller Repeat